MMPEGGAPHVPGFGAPAPGMPPQAMHPGGHAPGPAAMPAAPGDRRGELQQGGTRTVYEFTGAAAARDTASKGTFIGGTLDLSHHKEERESNLGSGTSTWVFLAVAAIFALGVTAYFVVVQSDGATDDDTEAAAAAPAEPAAAPEPEPEETKAAEAEEDATTADDAKADDAKADDAKADDAKADDAKADDAPKADAPKADAPKADEPKADAPKPKTPTKPRKKSTTTKKPSTSKPSTGGKTLSPKKPPRDPLKGLPKPP